MLEDLITDPTVSGLELEISQEEFVLHQQTDKRLHLSGKIIEQSK
jgi:hypothetical protein